MTETGNAPKGGARRLTALPGEGRAESQSAREARERHERYLAKQAAKAEAAEAAHQQRRALEAKRLQQGRGLHRIELVSDPAAIREIARALDDGVIPNTYVRAGGVVVVESPSAAILDDEAPPQVITIVDQVRLSRLLADHTFTYENKAVKLADGSYGHDEIEVTPKQFVTAAALSSAEWPKLRPLSGIVTAPVFRPDGTLVQEAGYDAITGLIYAPKLPLGEVPEQPTKDELQAARKFVRDSLLGDFPWVNSSRANYMGMLFAPLLRTYLGGVSVPLGAIDAASASTGKSLLAAIMTNIYSGYTRPWVGDENELRKSITSILVDQGGSVVCLDNVDRGVTVDQAVLAALLTMKVWSDRVLGFSDVVRVPNDRVWLITGNALSIGTDIATRTVLIRLDAQMPNPAERRPSSFELGDLEMWLKDPGNRATALRHLLILVRGWIVDGAPHIETPMRTFTPWASATAGLLDWMKEPGFMRNRGDLAQIDDEELEFGGFYAQWHALFGTKKMPASEVHETAVPDASGRASSDWRKKFLTRKKDGRIPSMIGFSKMLQSKRNSYGGGYKLNAEYDSHSKNWIYWVTKESASSGGDAEVLV